MNFCASTVTHKWTDCAKTSNKEYNDKWLHCSCFKYYANPLAIFHENKNKQKRDNSQIGKIYGFIDIFETSIYCKYLYVYGTHLLLTNQYSMLYSARWRDFNVINKILQKYHHFFSIQFRNIFIYLRRGREW